MVGRLQKVERSVIAKRKAGEEQTSTRLLHHAQSSKFRTSHPHRYRWVQVGRRIQQREGRNRQNRRLAPGHRPFIVLNIVNVNVCEVMVRNGWLIVFSSECFVSSVQKNRLLTTLPKDVSVLSTQDFDLCHLSRHFFLSARY